MFVSLYSTRLVLNILGAKDYGLFNLVGGVIAMLSFLNVAMSISTQRYLSFHLGAGDQQKLKSIFNASVILHFIIGIILVIILEVIGIYLFNKVLNIPIERIETAKIIFHFMVISTFFTITSVPYDAVINSHENMLFDAIISIFESMVKLGIAIYIRFSSFDKLIIYGLLLVILTIVIRIYKRIYCTSKYPECKLQLRNNSNSVILKEMASFAGWNLFGAACNVARNQGVAVVLNIFFGTVVNAAYGIANQVIAQLNFFSSTMLKSLNPQIVKSEGSGNRQRMLRLVMLACKFPFILLSFFAIPLLIEMHYILKIWLKIVPDYTVVFCRLIIIITLINQLSIGLQTAIQTIGKIKNYQAFMGTLLLFNLPVAYVLLKLGFPAYSVLIASVVLECVALVSRMLFARKLTGLSIKDFLQNVIIKVVLTLVLSIIITIGTNFILKEGFIRLLVSGIISSTSFALLVWFFGLTDYEKFKITELIITGRNKIVNLKFLRLKRI